MMKFWPAVDFIAIIDNRIAQMARERLLQEGEVAIKVHVEYVINSTN